MAAITLAIVEGDEAGRELPLTGAAFLGRDPGVDFVIGDAEVSARHASIVPIDGGFAIKDLDSTNGTLINGERISGLHELRLGDRIKLGDTVLEVRAESVAPVIAPAQVTRVKQIPAVPLLAFIAGPLAGTRMPAGGQLVVGREVGVANVIIAKDTAVSRRHAAFSPAGGGLTVQDLGSTNGTLVNGHAITGAVALNTGDRVQIGETEIEVLLPDDRVVAGVAPVASGEAAAEAQPNTIEVQDLVKEFDSRRVVDGINLLVNPGEIYGFLGPNGAGKSTTVHMLTTLLPPTSGSVRIAGWDVVRDGARVRSTIGVALQAAALDMRLNAWEHMELQTALQGVPRSQRKKIAEDLLERVALTEAASRLVGTYSGGMKRRLDLALALVHGPRVLFLDEPTTGLDPQSRTALWEEVARLVKDEGLTVFLTTQYLEEADVLADRVGIIDHGEMVAEDTPAALKEEIGRPTVEVTPVDRSDFATASEILARFGELASSTSGGVAARLDAGVDGVAEVVRALDAASIRLANLQVHAPTLDDVFIAKTGRSLEGAAKDQASEEQSGEPEPSAVAA